MVFRLFLLLAESQAAAPIQGWAGEDAIRPSTKGEFIFRNYPPRALAAGEQGSVSFRAEVNAKGQVLSCEITQSSGYRRLDEETCDLVVRHATFRPRSDQDGTTRPAIQVGTVNWRIPDRTISRAPRKASTKMPDKIICKRSPKTGSFVTYSRLCMTRREWVDLSEQYQEDWGSLQGRKGSSHGD